MWEGGEKILFRKQKVFPFIVVLIRDRLEELMEFREASQKAVGSAEHTEDM